jgi:hypothetical protein
MNKAELKENMVELLKENIKVSTKASYNWNGDTIGYNIEIYFEDELISEDSIYFG